MNNKEHWKEWTRAAVIRAVKTFAQSCVAMIPAAMTITQVDWRTVVGTGVLAAVVSILTSLAGLPEVNLKEDQNFGD